MRRAARVDVNQRDIVTALQAAGATVENLSRVGCGCPDLLVGYRGVDALFEVKTEDGDIWPSQEKWHCRWRGRPVTVVRSIEDALSALDSMGGKKRRV